MRFIYQFVLIIFCTSACATRSAQERLLISNRQQLMSVYEQPVPLPPLHASSSLQDFLTVALLNNQNVKAAYFAWIVSLESITPARSLEDPVLSFSLDIKNMVTSLMPGIMQAIPGPGKLDLRADLAAHESAVAYFAFQKTLLQAAFEVKRIYYELSHLQRAIATTKELIALQHARERLALAENEVNQRPFSDTLDFQTEKQMLATTLKDQESKLSLLKSQWKAALGICPHEKDPPLPTTFEYGKLLISFEGFFDEAMKRNPELQAVRSTLQAAHDRVLLAYKTQIPDFSMGLDVEVGTAKRDVKWKPQMGMSLPIWKEKIAATISASLAQEKATHHRLSEQEIEVAVSFVQACVGYEIATHAIDLLTSTVLPNTEKNLSLLLAKDAVDLTSLREIIELQKQLLTTKLMLCEEETNQQIQVASLSLLIAGILPSTGTGLDMDSRRIIVNDR